MNGQMLDWKELRCCDWGQLPLPAALPLRDGQIIMDEILRHLPGKRIAARCRWNGQDSFLKVFLCSREQATREAKVIRALDDAGISVPKLKDVVTFENTSLFVTEWSDGLPVSALPLKGVLPAIVRCVISLAKAGWYQRDLHLGNFLWAKDGPVVIDAGQLEPLTDDYETAVVKSLAMLCAQVPLADQEGAQIIIEAVLREETGWNGGLGGYVAKASRYRILHMMKKWKRSSSAVQLSSEPDGEWLLDRDLDIKELVYLKKMIRCPEQLIIIKKGGGANVYRCGEWVVKHYKKNDLRARVKRLLFRGRADISWVMGWTLAELGVPTPRPALLFRKKEGDAWIAFPWVDSVPLSSLIEKGDGRAQESNEEARKWLLLLHEHGFLHGDVKAQNILIDKGNQVSWVDLDASRYCSLHILRRWKSKKELKRFDENWTQFSEVSPH